jgi:hypothetical protein
MKNCSKCNIEKELEFFPKDKTKKCGYSSCCKECKKKYREDNKEMLKETYKNYRDNNKEKIKNYVINNSEKIKEYQKEYRKNNKETNSINQKEWYYNNINKARKVRREYQKNNKEKRNKKIKKRRLEDNKFRLVSIIRTLISNSFIRNGFSKNSKTFQILGCSFEEFKLHLESKFEPWMNWENQGLYNGDFNYGWDIDHMIPSSTAKCKDDIIILNHFTNLQPLCSKINRDIKRDNY